MATFLRTVFHAFGLVARFALIATLKRRARRKSIGAKLFFEGKIYDFPFKK